MFAQLFVRPAGKEIALPLSFATAGITVPILLLLLRIVRGPPAGGERGEAVPAAVEHPPQAAAVARVPGPNPVSRSDSFSRRGRASSKSVKEKQSQSRRSSGKS